MNTLSDAATQRILIIASRLPLLCIVIAIFLAACDDGAQHRWLMQSCMKKCSDTNNVACITACGQLAQNKCR